MNKIYQRRKPLARDVLTQVRTEVVNNKAFCEIWFMTEGCTHDANGGCTMCNYGKGYRCDSTLLIDELKRKCESLPPDIQELIVTPTGSMLDDREVQPELREKILQIFSACVCYDFFIETRVDTITHEKLSRLKNAIHAENINIEIGVECCDDWVLRNCINKNMTLYELTEGIRTVHECGMKICANVGVGVPFLSERCSIEMAKRSIHKAFELGCDYVVLFPYHIKPGTLTEWLWERNLYRCCSLWAIPEVLADFSDAELNKIQISWYRNYYTDKSKIKASPCVDEKDMEKVLSLLDEYKNFPCRHSLDELQKYNSKDRLVWKCDMEKQSKDIDILSVKHMYSIMAEEFSISKEMMDSEWEYMKRMIGDECDVVS